MTKARGIEVDEVDLASIHVHEAGEEPATIDDGQDDVSAYARLIPLIDAFVESYNAHDLDRTSELIAADGDLADLGGDLAGFEHAVSQCWQRRPTAVLTRGVLPEPYDHPAFQEGWEEVPVAILWDLSDSGSWARVALFAFDLAESDEELGLVELVTDSTLLDEAIAAPPDPDLPEGSRWEEWEEGADGDGHAHLSAGAE